MKSVHSRLFIAHGKIVVQSELNKGTIFTVNLPLGKDHLKPEEIAETPVTEFEKDFSYIKVDEAVKSEEKEKEHAHRKAQPIVLIVEDNADMRSYMHGCLVDHLHRKLYALPNQSANRFIRSLRLKRAAELLRQHYGNVAEIAYQVGFNDPAYFAECFRKLFGRLPSEFIKKDYRCYGSYRHKFKSRCLRIQKRHVLYFYLSSGIHNRRLSL